MTIKGSLYWSTFMLKRFSAAKKRSPVKVGSKNGGFSEIWRSTYYCGHRDPRKAYPWRERRFL